MLFSNIQKYTADSGYQPSVSVADVDSQIRRWMLEYDLQLIPDFQRGHVWDDARRIEFVEHILRGGRGSEVIRFNCPGWMGDFRGPMQLVDGLQRITAIRCFLNGDIAAFGYLISEFEDKIPYNISLSFNVNNLATRADVLRWYLELNSGGVVHTEDELDRVRYLLAMEG